MVDQDITSDIRVQSFFTTKAIVKRQKQEGSEQTSIDVPFSSLAEDRDGDIFSMDGLKDLVDQINSKRIPLYLNHGWGEGAAFYDVLDMLGYWKNARIDDDGVARAEIALDDEDQRSIVLARKIEKGLPIGFSVGFIPLDAERRSTDRQEYGQIFNKTDLLEISGVGIPNNASAVNMDGLGTLSALVAKRLGFKSKDNLEEQSMTKKEVKDKKMEEGEEEQKQEGDGEDKPTPVTLEAIKELFDECMKPVMAKMEELKAQEAPEKEEKEEEEEAEKPEEKMEEGEEKPPKEETQPKAAEPKAMEPKGIATAAPITKEEVDKGEVQKNTPQFKNPFE